jgi:hypothetical protein
MTINTPSDTPRMVDPLQLEVFPRYHLTMTGAALATAFCPLFVVRTNSSMGSPTRTRLDRKALRRWRIELLLFSLQPQLDQARRTR